MFENESTRKAFIFLVTGIFIATAFAGCLESDDENDVPNYAGQPLVESYMFFIQEPENEHEMMLAAAVTGTLTIPDGEYHQMFVLEDGQLDDHQLRTIQDSSNRESPKYLFAKEDLGESLIAQLEGIGVESDVLYFPLTTEGVNTALGQFSAYEEDVQFQGEISVASYAEALWVAPLAAHENKIISIGSQSYQDQEQVWQALSSQGVDPGYVVVVNPEDWKGADTFYSVFTPNGGETQQVSYHVASLSMVAPALAAYYQGYVITDTPALEDIWIPDEYAPFFMGHDPANRDLNDPLNDMYRQNVKGYGYYDLLKYINGIYGEISYVTLVGSPEAVPQFELFDFSGSEPDYTSSDNIYGFLDPADLYTMTAAVGRIINYNVQGGSNMIARTLGYDYLNPYVNSNNLATYQTDVNWQEHTSSWNGFEVADLRGQNTPGMYFYEDSYDEGYESSYWSTLGPGGGFSLSSGASMDPTIDEELSVSGLVAYRGHGSWHGSFYQWGYYPAALIGMGDDNLGHVEGEACRDIFLPPQSSVLVSCENSKIHGTSYGGDPIDLDRVWASNYLYAGAIGLCAATEVSYSNIGQDGSSGTGIVSQDYNWDINDLWYAGFWDNTMDGKYAEGQHDEEETPGGVAVQLTENRYIDQLRENFDGKTCSPFYAPPENMIHPQRGPAYGDEGGMHWKEVSMFTYYGDPAFSYYKVPGFEGENLVNRWH